jgi:hypothetical protein
MTPNQHKEEISKAYLAAIAASLGYKIGTWSQDDSCLDVTIAAASNIGGKLKGPKLDIQLKCTSDPSHNKNDEISWQLSCTRYDSLRASTATPILLVVLVLPENEKEWVEYSTEQLILRKCAYWISLRGLPSMATGKDSTIIKIPKSNVFSPDKLKEMMTKISDGIPL